MATRWHSCPRDVPLPCLHLAQDHTPLLDCCTRGWTLQQKSLSCFGCKIVPVLFTTIFWVLTGKKKKKKLHDYLPWFKWWLLFKCPELLLNTITIRREKLSRRKWKWKPSTVLLGGLNWKKNCFYKGCLLYVLHQCICFGYSMSLQFHSLNACVHLLPVSVTTSWIGWLQCHTHAKQSFLWPKRLHQTSHRAAHFTEWLNSNMINHFYQILSPWKKAQLQRTAIG